MGVGLKLFYLDTKAGIKMKRYLAVILVLALLLCGCNGGVDVPTRPAHTEQTPTLNGENFQPTRPDVESVDLDAPAITVSVFINPMFELTLSYTNEILAVNAQNEDAENLLAGMALVGQHYGDGMSAILKEARAQGFLKNSTRVYITAQAVAEGAWTEATQSIVMKPIDRFQEAAGITLTCEFTPAGRTLPEITATHTNKRGDYDEVICYDSANRHVLTKLVYKNGDYSERYWLTGIEVFWGADGTYRYSSQTDGIETGFTEYPDGTRDTWMRAVDDLGNRTNWELYVYADGSTHEAFYGNAGETIWSTHTSADGMTVETLYEDGQVLRENFTHADGTTEVKRYENGVPVSLDSVYSDGRHTVVTYYTNSNPKTADTFWPNGDYENQTYNENGTFSTVVCQYEGVYSELYYDGNGQMQSAYTRKADGTEYRDTYENGVMVQSVERRPDGIEYVTNFDGNGTVYYPEDYSDTVQYEDGSVVVFTYYSNGQIKTANRTWPNGDFENQTYNENGSISTQVLQREGAYSELHYDENGQLQSTCTRMADGIELSDFYENGIRVSSVDKYPNGDVLNWTYYEDGTAASLIGQTGGSYTEQYWDEVGNLIKNVWIDENGNRQEETYE